jgi:hypothetical protein
VSSVALRRSDEQLPRLVVHADDVQAEDCKLFEELSVGDPSRRMSKE